MLGCLKEKMCPWSKEAKSLVEELVADHPWLWLGAAVLFGLRVGRKGLLGCCKKKKC